MRLAISKLDVQTSFAYRPRTWREHYVQAVTSVVTAAVILAGMAVFANDVPWLLMLGVAALVLGLSALSTAWRLRRRR